MMKHENKASLLSSYLLWGGSAIITLLLISLISYYYLNTREQYEAQLTNLHSNLIDQQRSRLSAELDDVERYLQLSYDSAEQRLMKESQEQTQQAIQVMNSLYQTYHQQLSEAEMKSMLVEAVRELRFFDGRGYIFIDDMDGLCILLPTSPDVEGQSLYDNRDDTGHYIMRGLIDAVDNPAAAGYSRYRWYPPGNNQQMADKIAYVEVFEPYQWIVGAGEYLDRFQKGLKPEVLEHVRNIRFGQNGYVAVINNTGKMLANAAIPGLENIHYNQFENDLIRDSMAQILDTAKAGGGYTNYNWYRPGSSENVEKLSLVRPANSWGWILVAGVYEGDLNQLLAEQKASLEHALEEAEQSLIISFLVLGALALFITHYYSHWLRSLFNSYHRDITRQQQELQEKADSLLLSGRIVDSAYEGITVCDANNRILQVNSAFTRITGYSEQDAIGKTPAILKSGRHQEVFYRSMWRRLENTGYWRGEIWNRRKSGEVYPEWLSINVYKDSQGRIQNYIATFSDITQRKEAEQQLRYLAETDPLTGLANRRTLMFCLNRDLAATARYMAPEVALMFIDLDHFKQINDVQGHDVGDKVLVEVGKRLQLNLRESDLACRIGGDEFVAIIKLHQDEGIEQLQILSQRLLAEIVKPIRHSNSEISINCSIGIALRNELASDAFTLMKNADQALYEAKHKGRGRVCFSESPVLIDS
ncbi:sensor domain-containing diguanylate cyclase [Amphritea balenae]|nr:cache domain-containing protein [Amphritea balenae]GGK70177.1 hypothetical protein GCM10007941_20510 [Amphritea balenae]